MFEVPNQEALRSFNYCQRNCLLCPRCEVNAIARHSNTGYIVSCSLECGWSTHIAEKPLASAGDLSQKDAFTELHNAFVRGEELKTRPSCHESPKCVSLRAKWARKCNACMSILVMPNPSPSKVEFSTLSLMANIMPRIEDTGREVVAFNPLSYPIEVEMCSEIHAIEPHKPRNTVKEIIQGVPTEWVHRETKESRQVFMEKSRYKDFAIFEPILSQFKVIIKSENQQLKEKEMWVKISPRRGADSSRSDDEGSE